MTWPTYEPRSPITPDPDAYEMNLVEVAQLELDPWASSNALKALTVLAHSGRPFQPYDICLPPFEVQLPENPRERSAFLGALTSKALQSGLVVRTGNRVRSKSPGANGRKVGELIGSAPLAA